MFSGEGARCIFGVMRPIDLPTGLSSNIAEVLQYALHKLGLMLWGERVSPATGLESACVDLLPPNCACTCMW